MLLLTLLLFHPVHETIAEVEWNGKTGRIEVSIRLDAIDDQWIQKNMKRSSAKRTGPQPRRIYRSQGESVSPPLKPSSDYLDGKNAANWRLEYARSRFRLPRAVNDNASSPPVASDRPPGNRPAQREEMTQRYHWLGIEEERGHVWWFFEIETPNRKRPVWLENRMLFDKEANQANRVIVLGTTPSRTLLHTAKSPRQPLFPEIDDAKSK